MIDFARFRSCHGFTFQTSREVRCTSIRLRTSVLNHHYNVLHTCRHSPSWWEHRPHWIQCSISTAGRCVWVRSAALSLSLNSLEKEIFAVMLCSEWRFMNCLMAAYKVFHWKPESLITIFVFSRVVEGRCDITFLSDQTFKIRQFPRR